MRSLVDIALAATITGRPVEHATPHGVTPELDLTPPTTPETFDCAGCDTTHTAVPVLEPTEVYMVGTANARRYCTQDCLDDAAERHWTQP